MNKWTVGFLIALGLIVIGGLIFLNEISKIS